MEQDANITPSGDQSPKMYNVKVWMDANGNPMMQEVSEDELINGYLRQSDYTKKTQELAEERKMVQWQVSKPAEPNDDEAVEAYLQGKGYAKADTVDQLIEKKLQWITKAQQDEQTIQSLLSSNPDLKQFEWAIRKIAATDNSAIEDIVVKYGFSSHDKLAKAKANHSLMWNSTKWEDSNKPKPVSERTKDDWAKFEKENTKTSFR